MNILNLDGLALSVVVLLFVSGTAVIAVAGTRLTRTADRLADLTGLGEAIVGAVLLGSATSLPGIVTSVTTAIEGYAELSISNALGGIAAQTAFLAVADMTYSRANLEHAAASIENLMQSALLSTMLSFPLLAMAGPTMSWWGIHPISVALIVAYGFGIHLVAEAKSTPLWRPRYTSETRRDTPDEEEASSSLLSFWATFAGLALVVGIAGFLVAQSGIALADRTGLTETIVGGLLTAISTSLPELITSVAAVRRGALTLAVGGIIGGNSFDVLFVAFADVGYRTGSIYHAITDRQVFIIALTLLLTGILLMGLLRRERTGIMGIGFESFLVIILYLGAFSVLFMGG